MSFKESIETGAKKRDGTFNKNGEPSVLFTNSILSIPLGRDNAPKCSKVKKFTRYNILPYKRKVPATQMLG